MKSWQWFSNSRYSKLARNTIKSKFSYSGGGIAFDKASSWSFDNDFVRNIIIFGIDNTSSSHSENRKNNFLVLGEGPTDGTNDSIGVAKRSWYKL